MEFLEFDQYATHLGAVYLLALLLVVANSWWSRVELKAARTRVRHRLGGRPQTDAGAKDETS